MRDAVESLGSSSSTFNASLGGDSGGDSTAAKGPGMSHLAKLEKMRELAKMLESYGFLRGNFGGGGQTRTVDSADMAALTGMKAIELAGFFLSGANAGGQ